MNHALEFENISPVHGRICYRGRYLEEREALEKLQISRRAQHDCQQLPLSARIEICGQFLRAFDEHLDENIRTLTWATGKPISEARDEVATMGFRTQALMDLAGQALKDEELPRKNGTRRLIHREPLGVVLNIAAWNYPYVVPMNVVAAAILAGNSVLLKHAVQSVQVGEQIERAFAATDAPPGLVQNLMVDHLTVEKILQTGHIGHVAFTGSVRGGAEVYRNVASAGFASCGLELGGKDPAIVLDDAELGSAVDALVSGSFYNAGQSCCAVERIYVSKNILSDFVEAFVERTHTLQMGDPLSEETALGPVVSNKAARAIVEQTREAQLAGARQVSSDHRFDIPALSDCYLPARVYVDVDHKMALMREESFGPVIGIMPFDDEEHAIDLANDSHLGLTASVWTQDEERALRIMHRLQAGTVYMNRCDAVDPELPWVGAKNSGLGHSLSVLGIQSLTRPKSFQLKSS